MEGTLITSEGDEMSHCVLVNSDQEDQILLLPEGFQCLQPNFHIHSSTCRYHMVFELYSSLNFMISVSSFTLVCAEP